MKSLLICFGLGMLSLFTQAQKIFSEGSIRYDVYLDGSTKPEGVYLISVKGMQLKTELAMDNGFNNITLYNQKTGKTLYLNANEEQKYALEITEAELKEKNKRFDGATLTPNENSRKIAGYSCKGMHVQYENQQGSDILYTADLIPQNERFNTMFPGLKGIALEYETKLAGKGTMKFVANLVEIKSVDSNEFNLPSGYRVVTKEELKKIK